MKTNKFWYCEIDNMGQRTGNYFPVELPECCVEEKNGLFYCLVEIVHNADTIEEHTFLYTSEAEAQQAALS